MQFRIQSRRVQLIRTRYDADKKRNVQITPLLSFKQFEQPGQDIWRELNDEETQQLRDWLAQREAQSHQVLVAAAASHGAKRIHEVTEAVPQMCPEAAAEVWQALDALRKALTRAGHRRPAKVPTAPAPEPGQA